MSRVGWIFLWYYHPFYPVSLQLHAESRGYVHHIITTESAFHNPLAIFYIVRNALGWVECYFSLTDAVNTLSEVYLWVQELSESVCIALVRYATPMLGHPLPHHSPIPLSDHLTAVWMRPKSGLSTEYSQSSQRRRDNWKVSWKNWDSMNCVFLENSFPVNTMLKEKIRSHHFFTHYRELQYTFCSTLLLQMETGMKLFFSN